MKALTISCLTGALLLSAVAPASAQDGPAQPSAIERLVRQEDARSNDPRLGLAEKSAAQPSAVERLVRQEDARSNDPALGIAESSRPVSEPPTVQVVVRDGFDWLAAGIGGIAVAAAFLVAVGLTIVVRSQQPRRA